jgi:AcrR family transcriptional regulator
VDVTATVEVADGRRLRRQHNRQAVVEALVGLFDDDVYEPSSAQIAERAGLSPRSLFRYFDDVDDLTRAAIERQLSTARPLLRVDSRTDDRLLRRIEGVVHARVRLYDAITPGARAARICAHRNKAVAEHLREARAHWRKQIEQLFAPELRRRAELLPAIDVLCSFESYELLRHAQRMSRAATVAALVAALSALLDPTGEQL